MLIVYFNVLWNRDMMKPVIRGVCIYALFKRYFDYRYPIVFKLSLSSEIYQAKHIFDDFHKKPRHAITGNPGFKYLYIFTKY